MPTSSSRRLPAVYVISWSAVFLVAASYLVTLATRPEKLAEFLPPRHIAIASGASESSTEALDVEALRQRIAMLESDRAALRTELTRRTDHETSLTQRLAALEQQRAETDTDALRLVTTGRPAIAAPDLPVRAAARDTRRVAAKSAEPAQQVTRLVNPKVAAKAAPPAAKPASLSDVERLADASQAAIRSAPGTQGARIETGSLAKSGQPPVAFGAPVVSRPAEPNGSIGIRLGTGPSVDALRMTWGLVNERGKATLDKLEPRYMSSRDPTAGGSAYDLVAGPLPSAEEAQRVCAQLRAQKLPCVVSGYGGNAL